MEKVEFLCVHYAGDELAALNAAINDMSDEEQAERITQEVTRIKAEQDAKWVKSWFNALSCENYCLSLFFSALV